MWSEIVENHLYVYWAGQLVYKRWNGPKGGKTQNSVLFNHEATGWPNEEIR